jgi:hypothetical protein
MTAVPAAAPGRIWTQSCTSAPTTGCSSATPQRLHPAAEDPPGVYVVVVVVVVVMVVVVVVVVN